MLVGGIIALIVGVAGTTAVVQRANRDDAARTPSSSSGSLTTYLLVGTDAGGEAGWMTLLAVDPAEERGAIVYMPAHTAYEVPGRGLQGIGDALGSGGMPLLRVSAENMLGFEIDHYIEMSSSDAAELFGQTGDLAVNVPQAVRVPAGADTARVVLDEGEQLLPAPFQVDLLYEVGLDGDEAELGTRHLAFWQSFLEEHSRDPAALGEAVRAAGGALANSDAGSDEQAALFERLASLSPTGVTIASLPVDQEVVGDAELYSAEDAELRTFVEETIGELPPLEDEVRVQVLNGNGVPGIGQRVADALVGKGFRVVLSGNAGRLDYDSTRIVIYESTPQAQATARRAQELLGVGEVQVSVQEQGIVDLTIVVGKDFIGGTDEGSD